MLKIPHGVLYALTSLTLKQSGGLNSPPQHVIPQKRHQNHLSYLKYLTDTLFHSYCLHTLCARLKFSGSTFPKSSTVGGYFVLVYFFPGDPPFST